MSGRCFCFQVRNQILILHGQRRAGNPNSPLERALQQPGGAIKARLLTNKGNGQAPAI
jgi:hypothetical protein